MLLRKHALQRARHPLRVSSEFIFTFASIFISQNVQEESTAEGAAVEQAGKVVQIHGQPTIVVPAGATNAITTAVQTAQRHQQKVDDECTKAKKKVMDDTGASDSKEKRRAALKLLEKFCSGLQNAVDTEITQDVGLLAGKEAAKSALESPEESAEAERALFSHDLGGLHVTGSGAKKMAKNEAEAHALQRMAKKAVAQNQAKADRECEDGMARAQTSKDPKAIAKAKENCGKVKSVMKRMKKSIAYAVKETAEGHEKVNHSTNSALVSAVPLHFSQPSL